jgi:hypothetical protein
MGKCLAILLRTAFGKSRRMTIVVDSSKVAREDGIEQAKC